MINLKQSRFCRTRVRARGLLSTFVVVTAAVAIAVSPAAALTGGATPRQPTDLCAAMDSAVHTRNNPLTSDAILTTSRAVADHAQAAQGYTDDDGVAFLAATRPAARTDRVHHLRNRITGRNAYTLDPAQMKSLRKQGYTPQPDGFFASARPAPCLTPVYELIRASDGQQQLAVTPGQRDELAAKGFAYSRVAFYAGTDTTFSIAVLPDTQQENHVERPVDMFLDRANWLAAKEDALDLRYITHTGDVVDWDTPGHEQYEIMAHGVKALDATGIPYSFSIGNHDSMATGPFGGSARPGNTHTNQRITDTFNSYVGVGHVENLQGTFEPNKVDNSFSTFAAGGVDWLVLNLELWPRTEAVEWAKQILAAHPHHNAIVVTHSVLEGDGSIKQTNGGYGDNSPQYVFDQLIAPSPNVRFVFSGHTGVWAHTERTGLAGNPIHLINSTYHDWTSTPTRILEFDTAADGFSTYVYSPYTDAVKKDGSTFSRDGLQLVH